MEQVIAPKFTNEQIKYIVNQTRYASASFQAASGGATEEAFSPGCWACRIGLNVAIGAVVAGVVAALVVGSVVTAGALDAALAPAAAAIAAATGLEAATITSVFSASIMAAGASGAAATCEAIIEGLCEAMNACS